MSKARDIANILSANTAIATDSELTSAVSAHATATNGHVGRGTTENRPLSPTLGDLYFDTTLNALIAYRTAGWEKVSQDPPPQIASISPSTAATTGAVVTVSGSNFKSGVTVQFIGTNSVSYNSPLASFVSGSTVTATTPELSVAYEPYDVKVINNDNQFAVLENCLDVGGTPAWNTASGTIATINEQTALNVSVSATDPDGTSIVYSSNNLPAWISLNSSTGALTGTSPDISSDTTYSFDITASDGVNSSTRSFSVTSTYVAPLVVDFLVIAGGGGGGGNGGSGAGAGGYRTSYGLVSGGGSPAESPLTLTKGTNYSVTVGQGGTQSRSLGGYNHGVNGSNSVFHTITSIGGARGTGGNVSDTIASGGSGGGASIYNGNGPATGGAGTANQGYAGGNATNLGTWFQSAGGGGAGGVGGNPSGTTSNIGGVGGAGLASSITGTSVIRASGGSGYSQETATPGGGGKTGAAGVDNTGGGAGAYGIGGSGVVILRYPSAAGTITLGAGLTGSTSTVGSDKVTTITAGTGTVSWL
jgi:hypothetical protein